MFGDIDKNKPTFIENFNMVLCRPNRQQLMEIKYCKNRTLINKYKDMDEFEMDIPYYITYRGKQIKNPVWDYVKDWYKILINNEKYFVINSRNKTGEKKKTKHIHCFSDEYVLSKKYLENYTGTHQLKKDDTETGEGIFDEFSKYIKNWTLGTIEYKAEYADESLGQYHKKYRVFDIQRKKWSEFLFQDVQQSFECRLEFDTMKQLINVYNDKDTEEDKKRKNMGLCINDRNYLKKIFESTESDEIITRLYIYGQNNLNISSYNPTGQLYIDDYSYFKNLDYMSQDLIDTLNNYDKLVEEQTPIFYQYLQNLNDLNNTLTSKNNELYQLKTDLDQLQLSRDIEIKRLQEIYNVDISTTGQLDLDDMKNKDSEIKNKITIIQNNITQLANDIKLKQQEINIKQQEINQINNQISSKKGEINDLRNILLKTNNFTESQLKELEELTFEDEWKNENYFNAKELYFAGKQALEKVSKPPIEITIDVVNFLNIVRCQHDWDKLKLGDYINIDYDELNIHTVLKLIEIQHNIDDNKINLKFSNKEDYQDVNKYISDMLAQAHETNSKLNMFKHQWDMGAESHDLVTNLINSSLDSAKNHILSINPTQEISIDGHGVWLQEKNDKSEQLRMINNLIVFTKDNWQHASLAISPDGVVADNLYGRLVATNKLVITNKDINGDHSFLVDDSHMEAYNMDLLLESKNHMNRLYLNPETGFEIQRKNGNTWKDTLWLDIEGKVHAESFIVINTNSTLDDNGLTINNGKIIINSDNDKVFWADDNGNVYAKNFHVVNTDTTLNDDGLTVDNGKIIIKNAKGDNSLYANEEGDLLLKGRMQVWDKDTLVLDCFKDTKGGKIDIFNYTGKQNIRIGSEDTDNFGGTLTLYNNDGDKRLKLIAQSNRDNLGNYRNAGGQIQFYDNQGLHPSLITVNEDGNFGMYNQVGAIELNKTSASQGTLRLVHQSTSHLLFGENEAIMGLKLGTSGTDETKPFIKLLNDGIIIKYNSNQYIQILNGQINIKGLKINLN